MKHVEKFLLWYLITDEDVDPTLKGFANAIRLCVPFWIIVGVIVL
jgi:hypothetical protein